MIIDKNTKQVISRNNEIKRIMSEGGGTVESKYSTWTY